MDKQWVEEKNREYLKGVEEHKKKVADFIE